MNIRNKTINFLTYSDSNYKISAKRLVRQAYNLNVFRNIYSCTVNDIDDSFRKKFKNTLKIKRGAGYWIWKPYIINKYLKSMKTNDFLIYMDAGCSINKRGFKRFKEYLDILEESDQGVISFELNHRENEYTNKKCFRYFGLDEKKIKSNQLMATILIMKKNRLLEKQISEWLEVVNNNIDLFTDRLTKNELKKFKLHRHDQSIFSLIRKKYNPIILKDETYFVDFNSEYANKYPFLSTRIADTKKLHIKYILRLI